MIDLKRRGFLFGAAAALAVPAVRTFHFLPNVPLELPRLIVMPPYGPFDALQDEIQKAQMRAAIQIRDMIDRQILEAINEDNRWAVINADAYKKITGDAT